MINGKLASEPIAFFLVVGLVANGEIDSTSCPFPLLAIILRSCSWRLFRLRDRRQRIAHAMSAAPIPPAKMMVTMRPEVLSLSCFVMQLLAPAVGEKHSIPGAQDWIAVVVAMQVTVVPAWTEHADVDFMLVT